LFNTSEITEESNHKLQIRSYRSKFSEKLSLSLLLAPITVQEVHTATLYAIRMSRNFQIYDIYATTTTCAAAGAAQPLLVGCRVAGETWHWRELAAEDWQSRAANKITDTAVICRFYMLSESEIK